MKANIDDVFDEYVANLTLLLKWLPHDEEFMKKIEQFLPSRISTDGFREYVCRVLYLNRVTPIVDIGRVPILCQAIRDYVAIYLPSKPTDKYRSLDAQWEGP